MRLRCEWAWLGGPQAQPDVLLEVDGDRIVGVGRRRRGVAPPARTSSAWPASPCPASSTPTPTPSTAPCAAAPRPGRGRSGRGGSRCTAWPPRSTPDSYQRLARRPSPRWRWPASRRSASSTTSTTAPAGSPTTTRTRWARRSLAAAAEAGVRMTLLDTCYLHGGHRPAAERGAAALRRRRRRAVGGAGVGRGLVAPRSGPAPRSTPSGPSTPEEMAIVGGWADERGAPLHAHVSEQPAENEDCAAAYGRTPVEVLAGAGAGRRAVHRRPRHPPHRRRRRRLLGGAARVCFCPTTERDLADGIGPVGRARRGRRAAVPRVATRTR